MYTPTQSVPTKDCTTKSMLLLVSSCWQSMGRDHTSNCERITCHFTVCCPHSCTAPCWLVVSSIHRTFVEHQRRRHVKVSPNKIILQSGHNKDHGTRNIHQSCSCPGNSYETSEEMKWNFLPLTPSHRRKDDNDFWRHQWSWWGCWWCRWWAWMRL